MVKTLFRALLILGVSLLAVACEDGGGGGSTSTQEGDYPEMSSQPEGFPESVAEGESFQIRVELGTEAEVDAAGAYLLTLSGEEGGYADLHHADGASWEGRLRIGSSSEDFLTEPVVPAAISRAAATGLAALRSDANTRALVDSGTYYPAFIALKGSSYPVFVSFYYVEPFLSLSRLAVQRGIFDPDIGEFEDLSDPALTTIDAFSVDIVGAAELCGGDQLPVNGPETEGTIPKTNEGCQFSFQVAKNTRYRVGLSTNTGDAYFRICWAPSHCIRSSFDTDSGEQVSYMTPNGDREVALNVWDDSPVKSPFKIRVESASSDCGPDGLEVHGPPVSASVVPGAPCSYQFPIDKGWEYSITLTSLTGHPVLISVCLPLTYCDFITSDPVAGVHTLSEFSYSSGLGSVSTEVSYPENQSLLSSYELTVESHLTTCATLGHEAIEIGALIEVPGHANEDGASDYLCFDASKGSEYFADATPQAGRMAFHIRHERTWDDNFFSNSPTTHPTRAFVAQYPGAYFIRLHGAALESGYTFILTEAPE